MYRRQAQEKRKVRSRRSEWPAIEVLLRRIRIDVAGVISAEEILGCAAAEAANRGWTPHEVLVLWVRTKKACFSVDVG